MAPLPAFLTSILPKSLSPREIDYHTISDLSVSSLELDRRSASNFPSKANDLTSYLSSLGLEEREQKFSDSINAFFKRSSTPASYLSPHQIGTLGRRLNNGNAADPTPVAHHAGIDPSAINNKGVLALFALLSVGLVLGSIWFFFWAKNGGFVFREGDWEDYKSTVLRRKGPNGTTLSNATKSTKLGVGNSVEGEYDRDDMVMGGRDRGGRDRDVRAYRHEKPARVGGLNREADGSHFDYTNTDRSELMTEIMTEKTTPTATPEKKKKSSRPSKNTTTGGGFWARKKDEKEKEAAASRKRDEKNAKEEAKKNKKKQETNKNRYRQPSSSAYSYTQGGDDDLSTLPESTTSSPYDDRRPLRHSHPHTPTRSRQSSPTKQPKRHTHRQPYYDYPNLDPNLISETMSNAPSTYLAPSEADSGDLGTKSYVHHIPGLSPNKVGRGTETRDFATDDEGSGRGGVRSSGKRGGEARRAENAKPGYRRGGGRRRDSLSDSDGETGTQRSY
ncbi:MAG: hypothetical protein M1827_006754 [Pycnora praestabilis]|nr:MAG: hypothetical protein M1827_006754 [Pycnora praestabilis]